MRGFSVASADGSAQLIESTHYLVGDDGSLLLFGADLAIKTFPAEEWLQIDEVGLRLADT